MAYSLRQTIDKSRGIIWYTDMANHVNNAVSLVNSRAPYLPRLQHTEICQLSTYWSVFNVPHIQSYINTLSVFNVPHIQYYINTLSVFNVPHIHSYINTLSVFNVPTYNLI